MSFWTTNGVSAANLERLGPVFDVTVGTNGRYTSLNQAITDGHRRILLASGAILTADLLIDSWNYGFIIGPGNGKALNLGAYQIEVRACQACRFAGFGLQNVSGKPALLISGGCSLNDFEGVETRNCTTHGVHITGGSDIQFRSGNSRSNGGDGIRVDAGSNYCRISDSFIWGNTGYGINSLSGNVIAIGSRINGNTAGNVNGTFGLQHNVTT